MLIMTLALEYELARNSETFSTLPRKQSSFPKTLLGTWDLRKPTPNPEKHIPGTRFPSKNCKIKSAQAVARPPSKEEGDCDPSAKIQAAD